ncbi:MAG: alpha/beta hydrolase [Clostridiales bacterium]|jgi:alpha-beta hydrolase superfamily lysophospholipase|nr:alpha/beta hydrolase [Clostridiales bacterium]
MKEINWNSFDGSVRKLLIWEDVPGEAKGVLQIIHGMAEHAGRYGDFAAFLNRNGFYVAAAEQRAHKGAAVKGYESGNIFEDTVKDNLALTSFLKSKYDLPVSVLGHSYGSMIAQGYIENNPPVSRVVLSGSAARTDFSAKAGYYLARAQRSLLGGRKTAKLIGKLTFGAFDKPFKNENQRFAWVSRDKAQVEKYLADPFCGYDMSINFQASFMTGLRNIIKDENVAKIRKDLPILIASGSKDPIGGNNGKLVQKLWGIYLEHGLKNVKFKLYKDARHEILNESNRGEVYADILNFLEDKE